MIQIQVTDADGRTGPYTVKYGHTILGSQQVNVVLNWEHELSP